MSESAPLSSETKKAEDFVQESSSTSFGGVTVMETLTWRLVGDGGYASQQRETRSQARPDQMENDLELKKSNKVSTNKPDEVAGRKGKGLFGADKLA